MQVVVFRVFHSLVRVSSNTSSRRSSNFRGTRYRALLRLFGLGRGRWELLGRLLRTRLGRWEHFRFCRRRDVRTSEAQSVEFNFRLSVSQRVSTETGTECFDPKRLVLYSSSVNYVKHVLKIPNFDFLSRSRGGQFSTARVFTDQQNIRFSRDSRADDTTEALDELLRHFFALTETDATAEILESAREHKRQRS